jgi:hypothetical protein
MSANVLLHGSDEPLQELRPLRAGPVSAVLDQADLRYVKHGNLEIVRRVYVAVRDRNWNTIPGTLTDLEVQSREDSFDVRFRVRHDGPGIGFAWEGSIRGTPDGEITYAMDGRGLRDMLYNRIGLCVLHPWRESAGRPFRAQTPGGPVEGTLPRLIAPQRFEGGHYVPLFPSASRLEIGLEDGGSATFEFQGDLFETEDQRNWADASLKTYCTPLALGFPHTLKEGEHKAQAVTMSTDRTLAAATPEPASALEFGDRAPAVMAPVGLVAPSGAATPSARELALLCQLGPAHLRFDLHLADRAWEDELAAALATAGALDAQLEVALFVPSGADEGGELSRVRAALEGAAIARVLVVPEDARTTTSEETTPAALVRLASDSLGLTAIPIAGGTDMYFCELNRTQPESDQMDGVFWSVNGTTHASDDVSLAETPEAQGEQVRAARAFAPGKPLFVGPITLRRRFNVNETAPDEAAAELPDSVDPRQASLIAAAWTLASAKHLSEQGAAALTYFETVGWRGVIQGDAAPPAADRFHARAGQAFPLFHVLADLAELRGRALLECRSARPLALAGLAAQDAAGTTALIANLSPDSQVVEIRGLSLPATVRRLNQETAPSAMSEPERFRSSREPWDGRALTLSPYETVRIDG